MSTEPAQTALAVAIEASGFRKDFVAEQIGVKPWTLSRWCSAEHPATPDQHQREKLALLLRRQVDELFPPAVPPASPAASVAAA